MKKESKIENESKLLNDKKLRDTYAERIEVLDKVKQLMFLPGTEFQTVKQVADYYEVGEDAIVAIYSRHSDELLVDGMCNKSYKDFSNLQYESL